MKLYRANSLKIDCDQVQKRLYLRCLNRLSSREFRGGLLEALHCAEENSMKQWLLDLREIGELEEEEEVWLQRLFFPTLMSRLGTGNYVAMVLSEKCYNALLHESGKYGLRSYNEVIIMKNFCEVSEAVGWLDTLNARAA